MQANTLMKVNQRFGQVFAIERQLICLSFALLISVPNLAAATEYDLRSDWSDGGLPMAGVWVLEFDGTPLTPEPDLTITGADFFVGGQPGYWDLVSFVPIWFQARADAVTYFFNPPDADWLEDDIVFHDADAAPTSVTWTSPENGLADISVSLWNPRNFGRIQHYELSVNNVVLQFGDVDDTSDRANRISISENDVPITVGDTVALTFTSVIVEDYMGLDFSIVTTTDSDGDGVNDDDDFCPGTVIAEVVPSNILLVNRWALTDGDFEFDTVAPKGQGPSRSYSTTDTAGCSCEQIVAAQGLGEGHTMFGCSISAMDDWVEFVSQPPASCPCIDFWNGGNALGINFPDDVTTPLTDGGGSDCTITQGYTYDADNNGYTADTLIAIEAGFITSILCLVQKPSLQDGIFIATDDHLADVQACILYVEEDAVPGTNICTPP